MIVKFYDGCINKDETKDYKLINKTISNGITQEFYYSKTKTEIQKKITSLRDNLNVTQGAIDLLIGKGGEI